MRIIARSRLRDFWEKHNDAEVPLKIWYKIVEVHEWKNSQEVKKIFGNASIIGNNRVVFNIKGNDYRLVTYMVYKYQKVFIRFVGTHKEYDKIDSRTV